MSNDPNILIINKKSNERYTISNYAIPINNNVSDGNRNCSVLLITLHQEFSERSNSAGHTELNIGQLKIVQSFCT